MMTSEAYSFAGWAHAGLPLVTGVAPHGTCSLTLLSESATFEQMALGLTAQSMRKRQADLTLLHMAMYAITSVLFAPLIVDKVALEITPDQFGLVLDEQANLSALWVSCVMPSKTEQAEAQVTQLALGALAPIAAQARQSRRVSARGIANIMFDALIAGCRQVARSAGTDAEALVHTLIAAGPAWYQPARPILAYPDAGPAVRFYVPRTCCVLNKQPSAHACSTCPQYPDDATRLEQISEWLGTLANEDFRQVTGRQRVPGSE